MVFVFILELILLFFLARTLTSELSRLMQLIFRSRRLSVYIMAILFFPGTLIHEMSHAVMAKALFVYVGRMELMPQLTGDSLKLGSVEVGKTDIVRNFLIGIAPFVVGSGLLLLVLYVSFSHQIFGFDILTFLVLSFVLIISNTMYSSKKDMEGAVEFMLLIVLPVLILYFLGVRIPGLGLNLFGPNLQEFFKSASIFMAIPLILDSGIILFAKLATKQ